ncbi:uncharacterized protein LOC111900585 [Lactuca sativa]|uniref:uncharacterized protein LOC111900585 n=1 Tax=Lactuca sativa TaxID=4236 RepID=UPI000CD90049|nr:uncharacterized protein LOC111900585 [Lactuca sativa]
MADSLLSSIATFHTTKIIVTDPFKFPFNGSIPASMYACVADASKLFQEYKKLPSSEPRELTSKMIKLLKEADKPAKRGKKPNFKKKEKEGQVSTVTTPKKRKSEMAAPSQPKKRKVKKMAKNPRRVSTSDLDYTPLDLQRNTPPSEKKKLQSDDDDDDDDDAPVTMWHLKELNEKLDKLMASSSTQDSLSESAIKGIDDDDDDEDEDDVAVIEESTPKSSYHKVKPNIQEIKERVNEAINQENEKSEVNLLKQRKLKFSLWSLERLRKEVIEAPSSHWLEPVLSFDAENSKDS